MVARASVSLIIFTTLAFGFLLAYGMACSLYGQPTGRQLLEQRFGYDSLDATPAFQRALLEGHLVGAEYFLFKGADQNLCMPARVGTSDSASALAWCAFKHYNLLFAKMLAMANTWGPTQWMPNPCAAGMQPMQAALRGKNEFALNKLLLAGFGPKNNFDADALYMTAIKNRDMRFQSQWADTLRARLPGWHVPFAAGKWAVEIGDADWLLHLQAEGLVLTDSDSIGNLAYYAVCFGQLSVLRFLIAHGNNPMLPNALGLPLLHTAVLHNQAQIVSYLLECLRQDPNLVAKPHRPVWLQDLNMTEAPSWLFAQPSLLPIEIAKHANLPQMLGLLRAHGARN